jgi:zinc/manganese transport system substrate-binding protein
MTALRFSHHPILRLAGSLTALLLTACAAAPPPDQAALPLVSANLAPGDRLSVIATTSLVGDVVAQVGGDSITLTLLLPAGIDPHSYEPAAADAARMRGANVIFTNGLGLEQGLQPNLDALTGVVPIVQVSDGVDVIASSEHASGDPHTWQEPTNVILWTNNITHALSNLDPANADSYQSNAQAYITDLESLDTWIKDQVTAIPLEHRKLVTNHDTFAYFARRYDFQIIGTLLGSASEGAEPSAGQLAALVQTIQSEDVPAIFIENTMSDRVATVVSEELDRPVQVLTLYTDSLGPPGSGAETYLGLMQTNVTTIVTALAP